MLPLPRPVIVILLAALLALAIAVPFLGGTYAMKFATRVIVLAIFVLSLDFLIGITGLVSFGHAMFFGLGAYAVYFLSPDERQRERLARVSARAWRLPAVQRWRSARSRCSRAASISSW